MINIRHKISSLDWKLITGDMDEKGFALVPQLLSDEICTGLIDQYDQPGLFRKTISMERFRFGSGEYKYFNYPLPSLIQTIRETMYPNLAGIANTWMKRLTIDKQFPDRFEDLQSLCRTNNQTKPTVLLLKYGKGGYNALHQDLYGDIFFPIQLVLFLNQPGAEYTGGEFVLVQQIPRAQSRAIVLTPGKGDMLVFTTNFRPLKGNRGYYRVNMKHGVSELHGGSRHTLAIIFHDALT